MGETCAGIAKCCISRIGHETPNMERVFIPVEMLRPEDIVPNADIRQPPSPIPLRRLSNPIPSFLSSESTDTLTPPVLRTG